MARKRKLPKPETLPAIKAVGELLLAAVKTGDYNTMACVAGYIAGFVAGYRSREELE